MYHSFRVGRHKDGRVFIIDFEGNYTTKINGKWEHSIPSADEQNEFVRVIDEEAESLYEESKKANQDYEVWDTCQHRIHDLDFHVFICFTTEYVGTEIIKAMAKADKSPFARFELRKNGRVLKFAEWDRGLKVKTWEEYIKKVPDKEQRKLMEKTGFYW